MVMFCGVPLLHSVPPSSRWRTRRPQGLCERRNHVTVSLVKMFLFLHDFSTFNEHFSPMIWYYFTGHVQQVHHFHLRQLLQRHDREHDACCLRVPSKTYLLPVRALLAVGTRSATAASRGCTCRRPTLGMLRGSQSKAVAGCRNCLAAASGSTASTAAGRRKPDRSRYPWPDCRSGSAYLPDMLRNGGLHLASTLPMWNSHMVIASRICRNAGAVFQCFCHPSGFCRILRPQYPSPLFPHAIASIRDQALVVLAWRIYVAEMAAISI